MIMLLLLLLMLTSGSDNYDAATAICDLFDGDDHDDFGDVTASFMFLVAMIVIIMLCC